MRKEITFTIPSLQDTKTFGTALGRGAREGDVICLDGDLGAGKTTLAQAIAKGLQVPDTYYVTSPSFAIFHEYPGRIPLYHMDFYRLHQSIDVEDMGLVEYFYLDGLTVIEWAERAPEILPETALRLRIEVTGENQRKVTCLYDSDVWHQRLAQIFAGSGL